MTTEALTIRDGVTLHRELLGHAERGILMDAILSLVETAPFFKPVMPRTGQPFSVEMTNAGQLGWVADRDSYRYQQAHPVTGRTWPAIPRIALQVWEAVAGYRLPPECCLINWYRDPTARMGLHQDRDEEDFDAPVVSISLGDRALFRVKEGRRFARSKSVWLASGDVVVMGGPARLIHHGIDRIQHGSSRLVPGGGRINLTLRRVSAPPGRAFDPSGNSPITD